MIISNVTMKNFMSFQGEHSIDLKPGLTVVLGENQDEPSTADSNASGKTTLVNAIPWALNGVTPSGVSGKRVINHYSDSASVRLTFSTGLCVERVQGKKHSLKVIDNGEIWQGDVHYIQDKLTSLIGVGAKLFGSTVYLGQNAQSASFLYAIPSVRAEIMADLVDDEIFQVASELIKVEVKQKTGEREALGYRLSQAQEWVRKLSEDINTLASQIKNAEAQEALRRQELKERMVNCNTYLSQSQLILLKAPPSTMKELENSRSTYALRAREVDSQLRETGYASMPSLGIGEGCPTCMTPFSKVAEDRCREQVKKIKDLRALLTQEAAGIKKALEQIEERQRECRSLEQDKIKAKRDFDFYQTELGHLEEELSNVSSLSTQALMENLKQNKTRLSEKQREVNKITDDISYATADIAMLKTIQAGFSVDIRNYLFDEIRSQLAYFTKIYLYELAGSAISVEYPSTSKTLKEKFLIILRMAGQDQDFCCYSGGESWRVAFCILLALRDTMLQISKSKVGFVIVDDPVGALCKTGKRQFSKVLRKLANSGRIPQIFVTVPENDVIDNYDNIIKVVKSSSCSRVVPWG